MAGGGIIKGCAYDKGDNCKQAVISIILVNTEKGLVAARGGGRGGGRLGLMAEGGRNTSQQGTAVGFSEVVSKPGMRVLRAGEAKGREAGSGARGEREGKTTGRASRPLQSALWMRPAARLLRDSI